MFVNKFSGRCSNKNCSKAVYDGVLAGTGFTEKVNGKYITWCRDCVPSRIETAPVESSRRELTADGKVFTPYEPANLPLVKAMPGARWNGDGKYWTVSLEMGDRERLLELADKLKLAVPDSLRTVTVTEQAIAADTAGLYPFQVQGVNWMALRDKALLGDDMGCVDGEAILSVNRAGRGFKVKLADAYDRFHNSDKRYGWDASIPTYCRALCNGELRQHLVKNIVDKGVRPVLLLTLKSGKTLRLTPDHEVAQPDGVWTECQKLKTGDKVLTNGVIARKCADCDKIVKYSDLCRSCVRKGKRNANWKSGRFVDGDGYVRISGKKEHPRANAAGQVYEHILVMEELLGRFLDFSCEEVHHKNENRADNRLENLEVVTKAEHKQRHKVYRHMDGGTAGRGGKICFVPKVDEVVSVVLDGETRVFDIVMDDPHRNFVANGIIVHNCGKTVQALRALPKDARCLCVVPACVKFNWRDECNKWRPDLEAVVLSGKTAFRWPAPGQVVIINYDVLPEWLTPPTRKKGEPWIPAPVPDADRQAAKGVTLICDEVHYAKNFKAKRSKKVKSLTGIVSKVWALTGTPLLNRPSDLFGVLDSVGMAHTVFGSWKRFMQLFNACEDRWGGIAWGSPEPIVPELLRRVMLRRTRAEVLPDLPNKTYSTIVLNDIPASLRKKMDSAWEEFGDVIDATDELPPFEQFSAIRADLAESRIEAVTEYVENCEEQEVPLVVFCVHRAPIDALATRPGWATITGDTKPEDRQNVVRRFQAGELKGVGLTIAAGGVGLTLTRAWRELFVDLDWTPANNLQAEDRCCRIGQESDKVEIVRMVSDHILDQHVLKLLDAKMAVIRASIDGTVKAVAPAVVSESVPAVSETEEEFAARMAKLEEARKASEENAALVAKNQAKTKTERIHGRLKDKAEVKEMPEGLTDDVRAAFRYMLGVCDGAEKRDGQGFNKPDAMLAHYVLASGLETPQEVEAAYFLMVPKYRGQLSGEFPKLFPAKVRKPRAKKVVSEGVTA